MKPLLLSMFLCGLLLAESPSEKALRLQLQTMQASLDKARADLVVARAANTAHMAAVQKSVAKGASDATVGMDTLLTEAQLNDEMARRTAVAAKQAAQAVAKEDRDLFTEIIIGTLFLFFLMLGALGFVVVDVRSKATADRRVFLDAAASQHIDITSILKDTKVAMIELERNTNSRLSQLLEAKDVLREQSNLSELARGTLIGREEHRRQKS